MALVWHTGEAPLRKAPAIHLKRIRQREKMRNSKKFKIVLLLYIAIFL